MHADSVPLTGYTLRRPTPDDFAATVALLAVVTGTAPGAPAISEEELRQHWSALALERDGWLLLAPDDTIVGYAALHSTDHVVFQSEAYVHPAHHGRGLGTWLLRATEARAYAHHALAAPGVPGDLYHAINAQNLAAHALLARDGYAPVRHFWRMEARLAPPLPAPIWPDGITVRAWESEDDDWAMYQAAEDAFRDHWAHEPTPFAVWRRKSEPFDPGLWLAAWAGDEIAGVLIGQAHPELGWVEHLGVRRAWRQRGLGLALLHQGFAAFAARGWTRVGLDVDTQSATGALRLYERAGMYSVPDHAITVYAKALRPDPDARRPDPDAPEPRRSA